jgi:arabinose-5-phosphate isomerase
LKVESVMHPLNEVAQIDENDSISSCASKMTNMPLGAALHLEKDMLKGIVTEGDLRKSIASTNDLSNPILNFVNCNPISINPSISILDAMKLMEDRHSQISCLPVIDSEGKCIGLVRLHDLYQTKLV